jgi:hypothetical protein
MCSIAGMLCIALGIIGLGGLIIFGLPDDPLDLLAVLSPYIPSLLLIVALASLRLSTILMWVYCFAFLTTSIVVQWPAPKLSPFTGYPSDMRIAIAALTTLGYLVLTVGRQNDDAKRGDIGRVRMMRGEN